MAKLANLLLFLATVIIPLSSVTAAQSSYPSRPVHIIVGFGAGSSVDTATRVLARTLSKNLGQQVVVEDRPGAGSNIAADFVAHASNDGYTLFMATIANAINATVSPNIRFDFSKDFAPITLVGAIPMLLVAHPSLGVSNVKELIALAKRKPRQIFFGSSGTGTSSHLSGELFNALAGVKLVHVPYSGSAQALTDLLAGRISLLFSAASTTLPYVRAGKLKALAMAQSERAKSAPQIPSMSEAGVPGFDASVWFGLVSPANTPPEVVDRLSRAVNDSLKSSDVIQPLHAQGIDLVGGSPDQFSRYIQGEIEKWGGVAATAGLKR
ncbi:MAG TPA: tripartite tricarboxylate transporter substrate binding protein [Rhizomicrobium sp.]|nr:tripartite tricarboxylate transporter substrate binding protein [Rhizomicrobium sp.]